MTCTCEQCTCENCKHWEKRDTDAVGVCKRLKISESGSNAFGSFLFVRKGDYLYPSNTLTLSIFGCVYFEEKPADPFVVNDVSLWGDYVVYHKANPCYTISSFERTPKGLSEAHELARYLNELWKGTQ